MPDIIDTLVSMIIKFTKIAFERRLIEKKDKDENNTNFKGNLLGAIISMGSLR